RSIDRAPLPVSGTDKDDQGPASSQAREQTSGHLGPANRAKPLTPPGDRLNVPEPQKMRWIETRKRGPQKGSPSVGGLDPHRHPCDPEPRALMSSSRRLYPKI